MKDSEYLKQMFSLNEKMNRLAKDLPTDMDQWHAAIDEMHRINNVWYNSRRQRPWGIICFCLFLLYCFAWLIWTICF